MATVLLIVIFIAFMGMGVPDSLFGAAWPAIYKDLGVPVSWASFVSVIIAVGTIISSLNAAKVAQRFGTAKVTLVSTVLTAAAILGFAFSRRFIWLVVFSIPVGFGAGAIDAVLNNYVALYYKASHMNFMQCCYGVGVSVSPYLMSLALSRVSSWNRGYLLAFIFQMSIVLVVLLSMPLWKRVKHTGKRNREEVKQTVVPVRQLLRDKNIRRVCVLCIATCGLEFFCGGWGATFLVESRNVSVDMGAKLIIAFYLGLMVSRLFAGFVANRLSSWRLIILAEAVTAIGVVVLLIPNAVCGVIGLFLLGFNCILAPNILYLAPESFGAEISQSVSGLELAAMYAGIMSLPAIFGLLTKFLPVDVYPVYVGIVFTIVAVSTVVLYKGLRKGKKV